MTIATYGLIFALVGGALAGVVAVDSARRPHGTGTSRVGLAEVVRAGCVGIVVFLVAFVFAIVGLDLDPFGMMHLGYLFLVVAIPVAAALVLVARVADRGTPDRPPIRLTGASTVVAVLALTLAPLGIYMTHVEPYWLSVEEIGPVPVAAVRAGQDPIRIAVLTDYQVRHIGDYEVHAIDELLAAHPDVVLLPGDVFQDDEAAFERELPALRAQLARLDVPGGAFLVDGDTDPMFRLRRMVEGTPVRLLANEIVQTRVRDRVVTIGGIELDYQSAAARSLVHDLDTRPGDEDIRILLAHRPDAAGDLPRQARTDLVVTGHTHGGQVAIPGFGPLMTLSDVPRDVAGGGLHAMDGRQVFVGRGVGVERGQAPQIRLFVRPQIGVLTLEDR